MTCHDPVDCHSILSHNLELGEEVSRLRLERDKARGIAVALEQENAVFAELEQWTADGTFGHLCCGVCLALEEFTGDDFESDDGIDLHDVVSYIRGHECMDNCICEDGPA